MEFAAEGGAIVPMHLPYEMALVVAALAEVVIVGPVVV